MTSQRPPLLTLLVAVCLLAPVGAEAAAKAKKNKKAGGPPTAQILARFDRNHDGVLDAGEAAHVRHVFEALQSLDTDKDGKLSDSEITAAKVAKKGERRKKQ